MIDTANRDNCLTRKKMKNVIIHDSLVLFSTIMRESLGTIVVTCTESAKWRSGSLPIWTWSATR
jgi:hypothetical protein